MLIKIKFLTALITAIILLVQFNISAQPAYLISAKNGVLLNDFSYEFDIHILRTGIQPLELASLQVSVYFNNSILNGGAVSGEHILGTSELSNSAQYPFTPNLTFSKSGGSIRQFRISSKIPPGAGNGSVISNTEPGTRFGRFRITSSNPLIRNLAVGWQWNFSVQQGDYASYINAYTSGANTNITNQANFQMDLHDPLSSAVTFQLAVFVHGGWNMVSVPGLHPVNQNIDTWWIDRDPGANVFRFNNGYHAVTSLTPGTGYWMKHSGARLYNTGDEWPLGINTVPHNPLTAFVGWNLIGVYENPVSANEITTTPPGLQSGSVFSYSLSTGYNSASELVPGYGYWIKLTGDGLINLSSTLKGITKTDELIKETWGRIILTDNAGKNYILYAFKGDSPKGDASVNPEDYQLPPVPPEGMFDVRYGSGRFVENLKSSIQSIELNGVEYPVKVRVENIDIKLHDETGKIFNERLKSGEEIVIQNIGKLFVREDIIPDFYSLEQNFPNPFNPVTLIKWQQPMQSQVLIKVYDILGNEITVLVNEEKPAGNYSVNFDASAYASGVYFYSITAGGFRQTKKMILAK